MIVVDASALVDVLTRPTDAAQLRLVLAKSDLHAPAMLDYEVVSALRRRTLRLELSVTRAQDALTDFEDLSIRRWPLLDGLRRRVFSLRDSFTAYDASYVALAEALECPLVTRDQRLARAARELVEVEVG
ncbi:MAG TPA: type II toxin-antitoxin system VapC family toxin [Acidothermales bacterium]|nr:type II toxin-antitoxin system VapC family toxin [Actinomycetes bacterium]